MLYLLYYYFHDSMLNSQFSSCNNLFYKSLAFLTTVCARLSPNLYQISPTENIFHAKAWQAWDGGSRQPSYFVSPFFQIFLSLALSLQCTYQLFLLLNSTSSTLYSHCIPFGPPPSLTYLCFFSMASICAACLLHSAFSLLISLFCFDNIVSISDVVWPVIYAKEIK